MMMRHFGSFPLVAATKKSAQELLIIPIPQSNQTTIDLYLSNVTFLCLILTLLLNSLRIILCTKKITQVIAINRIHFHFRKHYLNYAMLLVDYGAGVRL